MSRSWRDYLAATPPPDACDNSDNRDVRSDSEPETRPIVTNVTNVTGIPSDIVAGLERLKGAAAPRTSNPERWPAVVADALRLAADGWAAQALKLGWSPLDLFGAVTDKRGDPNGDGLAVKLCGRPLLALCASFATVSDGTGARTYLYRGSNAGARLLWQLGNGRG
jgi:hypothetical protein